jgi:hypothetical protein
MIDTASDLLERTSAVLTPERTVAVGGLIDRLDATLTAGRAEATARARSGLESRPDVLPRALEAIDRLASSRRPERLGDAFERLLSNQGLDRLLDLAADNRIERLLDLALTSGSNGCWTASMSCSATTARSACSTVPTRSCGTGD